MCLEIGKHSRIRMTPVALPTRRPCFPFFPVKLLLHSRSELCGGRSASMARRHGRSMMPIFGGGKVFLGLFCCFVWISGFLMLIVRLHTADDELRLRRDRQGSPSITVFSAPHPRPWSSSGGFDPVGARQVLAVRSWLALSPDVAVVLFGRHPAVLALAASLGPRVLADNSIDFTFLGTLFFHSMIARSQAALSDISVFIDPEVILLPDMLHVLYHANKLDHDWFLVCDAKHVSYIPNDLEEIREYWIQQQDKELDFKKLQELLQRNMHSVGVSGRVLMAWNRGSSLHAGILPPFLFGKGTHNEWILNEVLSSGFRRVFDASEILCAIYPENMGWKMDIFPFIPSVGEDRMWEYLGNCHLAAAYGSLYNQGNNVHNDLIKLIKCSKGYVFIKQRTTICSMEDQGEIFVSQPLYFDNGNKYPSVEWCRGAIDMSSPFVSPHHLQSLLQVIADKNKTVVLAVAGDNYRDMLMSWVCRLRHLKVTNFIVCALDFEVYTYSLFQGLPVFRDPLAPSNISFNNCHFGTDCFKRVTKVKSRIVLDILKLGYNVLLSDVDVYWFDNPLSFLFSFGPSTLVAQSDEYNETGPINLPRRLNSGFYFARSDDATISAMEKVVVHASSSNLSEQPSLYDVLCGEGGLNRMGDNGCLEPSTNLTVRFLDRNLFPNGAYKGLWEEDDVLSACRNLGCFILHNNWINGRKRKWERQVLSRLWDYDPSTRMCLQSWHQSEPED